MRHASCAQSACVRVLPSPSVAHVVTSPRAPVGRVVRRIVQLIVARRARRTSRVCVGAPRPPRCHAPLRSSVDQPVPSSTATRPAVPKRRVGRRRGRRRALLVLVEAIQRADHLEVPIALRVGAQREAVRRVLLRRGRRSRSRIPPGRRTSAAPALCDVRVDAGVGVVLPVAERVRRAQRRRDVVRGLDLRVRHVRCAASPFAPSTFAGAPSLFCSAKPPVVPVGNVALVTYASGWLWLF